MFKVLNFPFNIQKYFLVLKHMTQNHICIDNTETEMCECDLWQNPPFTHFFFHVRAFYDDFGSLFQLVRNYGVVILISDWFGLALIKITSSDFILPVVLLLQWNYLL